MMVLSLEKIKGKIKEDAKVSDDELNIKIKAKMEELAGLISEEGAAHIVANELGVQLMNESNKIKDLAAGMRGVEINGRVTRIFEIRDFQTAKGSGKVGSFIISDETGTLKVVLWNDQADKLKDIKEEDIVKLTSGYTRENNGSLELHLNDRSQLSINPVGVSVKKKEAALRKSIKELNESDQNIEILPTLVEIYDPRFFSVCPQCGKRVLEKDGFAHCASHGGVKPSTSYVMNVIGDDGTETMRVVLWKSQAERLLGMKENEVLKFKEHPEEFMDIKHKLLGEIVKFVGKVNKNTMFDRLEFNARLVFMNPDPNEELKRLEQ